MAFKKSATENKLSYEVLEDCGILSVSSTGWELRLRYISWNGKEPKYDLRPWNGDRCGKGITLTGEELEALLGILKKMEEE